MTSCTICCGAKRKKASGELLPQRIEPTAFKIMALDVILGMPKSKQYDAVLVMTDTYTKVTRLRPTAGTASTLDIAKLLSDAIVTQGFLPSTIITDRDSKYISKVWKHVMTTLNMKSSITSPYHQQVDPAERTIQTIETILRCYNDEDWLNKLPIVEMALNETINVSTAFRPNNLLYRSRTPPTLSGMMGTEETVEDREEWNEQVLQEAILNIKRAQEVQSRYYNKRHSPLRIYKPGDEIYLNLELHTVRSIPTSKLSWPKWGPWKVIRTVGPRAIELDLPTSLRIHKVVSIQHVEYYQPDDYNRQPTERGAPHSIAGQRLYYKKPQVLV